MSSATAVDCPLKQFVGDLIEALAFVTDDENDDDDDLHDDNRGGKVTTTRLDYVNNNDLISNESFIFEG
jgi:hypothetical protein